MTHKSQQPQFRVRLPVAAALLAAFAVAGCDHVERHAGHPAEQVLLTPQERHPIVVSEEPHRMNMPVPRGARGMTPQQRARFVNFISKYNATDRGNSKIVISVPAGSGNDVAAMNAVSDMRPLLADLGVAESSVSIEPYDAAGSAEPPIRVAYSRYTAEGPECGRWTDNVSRTTRNLNYENFGCANQRNLAAMVANPADLIAPRTMTPAPADRRGIVYDGYIQNKQTSRGRSAEERAAN